MARLENGYRTILQVCCERRGPQTVSIECSVVLPSNACLLLNGNKLIASEVVKVAGNIHLGQLLALVIKGILLRIVNGIQKYLVSLDQSWPYIYIVLGHGHIYILYLCYPLTKDDFSLVCKQIILTDF